MGVYAVESWEKYKVYGVIAILLGVVILPLAVPVTTAQSRYQIENDIVYINDSNVFISAKPHTIHSSGWVCFNFTSKRYSGNIDMIWGFNVTNVKPKRALLYHPHYVNWTTWHSYTFYNVTNITDPVPPYECTFGNSYNLYHKKVTYYRPIYEYEDNTTVWNLTTAVVCFDNYTTDGINYTAYWHTNHSRLENWLDISKRFKYLDFDFEEMNRWYYVTDVPVEAGKTYTMLVHVEVPVTLEGTSGKYWVAIKPSTESLSEAIVNNHFYYLDPWWNASWGKKRPICINNTGNSNTLSYYQVMLNITYDEDMQPDFDDIRVVNESSGEEVPYWIEDKVDGSWCKIWFNASSIPASSWCNDTYYLYYNNSEASSASNGEATFEFFDDFEDYTEKWDLGGDSPTVSSETINGRTVVNITNGGTQCGGIWTIDNVSVENRIIERMLLGWGSSTDVDENLGIDTTWKANYWCSDNLMHGVFDLPGGSDKHGVIIGDNGGDDIGSKQLSTTEWKIAKTIIETGKITGVYDGEEISETGTPTTYTGKILLGVDNNANSAGVYYDWIRIRKYTSPEPTATLGDEQSSGATDTSFTVTLPSGYTYAHFNLSGLWNASTQTNYPPEGQSDSQAFYSITNTGDVDLTIRMKLNQTIPNIILKADTDNDPTDAKEINTTYAVLYENLAPGSSVNIWLWTDLFHAAEQQTNRTLEINVTQS